MPLGKVFDAREGQVLISPVSNFYQGKAMRAGLKQQEQESELRDLEIQATKYSLSPEAMRAAGEAAKMEADKLRGEILKNKAETSAQIIETRKEVYGPIFEDVAKKVMDGEPIDAAEVTDSLGIAARSIGEEEYKNFTTVVDTNQDGILGEKELSLAAAVYGIEQEDDGGGGFTLSPGAKRYGEDGALIAENPSAPPSETQRDEKIRAATEMLSAAGIPNAEEEATKVVDGIVTYTPDPSGGSIYRIDKLKGTAEEINIQSGIDRGERPEVPTEGTLWNLAEDATGIIPTMAAGASKVSGAVGGPISEKAVAARQKFKAAENDVIRAFSLNPRYPVAEQNRIKENISVGPAFFDSKELMHARMTSIDAFLREKLALLEWESQRPGIDKKQRAEDEKTMAGIQGFLDTLGAPGSVALPQIKNDEEYNALPSGTVFIDPDGKRRTKP